MLIKCSECGHDNQMGAIFCRECGEKLDFESVKPIVESKSATNVFGIIRRVIAGVILLVLIYIIAMMFFPESPKNNILTDDQQAKASEKFDALVGKIDGRYGENSYVFTPDEVTYLYNQKMTENTEGDTGSYAIENMYFTVDSRNFIHLMIQSKLAGKVPVTFAIKGLLVEDSTQLQVLKAKMGHFSIPNFLKKKVVEKFLPGTDAGVIAKIINGTKDFKVENGDFTVDVKKEK